MDGLRRRLPAFLKPKTPVQVAESGDARSELLADLPLSRGEEDELGRLSFAVRIADLIRDRKASESLVIGIYGRWGDGKTTVLRFVEEAIRSDSNIVFVRYNPWLVDGRDSLLRSFFETLAAGLGTRVRSRGVLAAEEIRKYSGYLAPLLPPLDALHRTSAGISTRSVEDDKKRISEILSNANKRIVVAIDDIDRLERSEIAAVLKVVRLVADFERTVYLLAFDRRVVSEAIRDLYAGHEEDGGSFLEKIVQLPLLLPPPEGRSLEALALKGIDAALAAADVTMSESEISEFGIRFRDGIAPAIVTPRAASQFANAAAFALPALRGEASNVDVLSVEALRSLFPRVHEFVRDNGDLLLGLGQSSRSLTPERIQATDALWQAAVSGLSAKRQASARSLVIEVFPRFDAALGDNNHFGDEWLTEWRKEKRAASPEHFERYFTYHVARHQVPDQVVTALLDRVSTGDIDDLRRSLSEHITEGRAESLLRSFRDREREIPEASARTLALALAPLGGVLPRPQALFSFTTPFEQAAILVARLVERLPFGQPRDALAVELVSIADPLPFAAHIARWLRSDRQVSEGERVLDQTGERRVIGELVARIQNEAALGLPLYVRYPADGPLLLNYWHQFGDPEASRRYLAITFAEVPLNAIKFLRTYLPTTFSIPSGAARYGDFERENYLAVQIVVDPNSVAEALLRVFPDLPVPKTFPHSVDGSSDRLLAEQFIYLHRHPAADPPESAGDSPDGEIDVTPDREP